MRIPIRIYYEDTDCGGVVYYANYLKYFERGRTEYLRERGIGLKGLRDGGIIFVVTKVEVEYLAPGRYDDILSLDTRLTETSRATITFGHALRREGSQKELVRGVAVLAAVNREGKPVRIPEGLKEALGE